jgi:Subunit CCDC53 of WASH complex
MIALLQETEQIDRENGQLQFRLEMDHKDLMQYSSRPDEPGSLSQEAETTLFGEKRSFNEIPHMTIEGTASYVPSKDHPKYAKYFTMLKVGMPIEAAKVKMQQEGVDPSIIGQNADYSVPFTVSSGNSPEELTAVLSGAASYLQTPETPAFISRKFFNVIRSSRRGFLYYLVFALRHLIPLRSLGFTVHLMYTLAILGISVVPLAVIEYIALALLMILQKLFRLLLQGFGLLASRML